MCCHNVADIRGLFPELEDTIYLNTASMCVGRAPAREAYERAVEDVRAGFAQIVGAQPGRRSRRDSPRGSPGRRWWIAPERSCAISPSCST